MPPPSLIGDHSGTTMRNNPVARSAVVFASRVHFVFEKTKLKPLMCFFIFRPYCHSQREYVISAAGSTGSASGSSSTPAASTPGCGCRLLLAGAGAGLLGLGGTANAKCGPGGGGRETCQRILLLLIHRAFCFTTSGDQ